MIRVVQGALPSGTVTFVFTDVEGSTSLLDRLGTRAYAKAVAEHRRVLRETFGSYGGVEVDTQGDALFFAFPRHAARSKRPERPSWHSSPARFACASASIRVSLCSRRRVCRNRCPPCRTDRRGRPWGPGLVSASTASFVETGGRVLLVDLGSHRLKDLSAPERIAQLGEQVFPALKVCTERTCPSRRPHFSDVSTIWRRWSAYSRRRAC